MDPVRPIEKSVLRRLNRRARYFASLARIQAEGYRRERQVFNRRLRHVWRDALDLYEQVHCLNRHIGVTIGNSLPPGDQYLEAIFRIQARACSISSEVHALLVTGHASGAYARWRTLHELAVVSLILKNGDTNLAVRYLDHEWIERAKAARLNLQYPELVGETTDEEVKPVLEHAKALVEKYGKAFRTQYGWASDLLGKKDPKFAELEHRAGLARWRPYYLMSSWGVHASAKGALWNLAEGHLTHQLVAGPSIYGLADPGHQTLIALNITTANLVVTADPSIEMSGALSAIKALTAAAGDSLLLVHQLLEGTR